MTLSDYVSRDPNIMSGALVFRGTRVLVRTLFDYLEEGHSIDRFLAAFQGVSRVQVEAVLEASRDGIEDRSGLAA